MDFNKNMEESKGYFALSQILIILAGFLFASGGISYTSASNHFDKAVILALTPQNLTPEQLNLSNSIIGVCGDLTKANLSLWRIFIEMGMISAFLSIFVWFLGMIKIKKL